MISTQNEEVFPIVVKKTAGITENEFYNIRGGEWFRGFAFLDRRNLQGRENWKRVGIHINRINATNH